jgi:hypothetical protein
LCHCLKTFFNFLVKSVNRKEKRIHAFKNEKHKLKKFFQDFILGNNPSRHNNLKIVRDSCLTKYSFSNPPFHSPLTKGGYRGDPQRNTGGSLKAKHR